MAYDTLMHSYFVINLFTNDCSTLPRVPLHFDEPFDVSQDGSHPNGWLFLLLPHLKCPLLKNAFALAALQ